jgi:hypothetical protein
VLCAIGSALTAHRDLSWIKLTLRGKQFLIEKVTECRLAGIAGIRYNLCAIQIGRYSRLSLGSRPNSTSRICAMNLCRIRARSRDWHKDCPATDASGKPIPGSIATLEKVKLNASEQWITIRGQDVNKPVLLFLAGGPGGTDMVVTRIALGALEEHFVVVNWDQPGAGKSYHSVPHASLTPDRYIADAHELTLYLRQRFGQAKIYVLGESWGSVLGIGSLLWLAALAGFIAVAVGIMGQSVWWRALAIGASIVEP